MTGFDLEARSHDRGEIERRWSQSLLDRRCAIGNWRWCGSSDFGVDWRDAIGVGVDLRLIGASVDQCWCGSALVWRGVMRSVRSGAIGAVL